MIRRVAVTLLFLACSPQVNHEGGKAMSATAPFEIRLAVTEDRMLRATLRNTSTRTQTFLCDPNLQPVQLKISGGGVGRPFDERTREKFDRTLYLELYQELEAGEELVVTEGKVQSDGSGRYQLRWGPFVFRDLRPGKYTAQAIWTSAHDEWVDRDSKRQGRMQGVWKGTIRSQQVELNLP